jgi:hydrogenase expression/formation protein HypE
MKSVQLAHGSGGQAMQQLIGDLFMQAFANPWLAEQEDQARLDLAALAAQGDRLAFSTDSYVIDPLFFPGGNIGKLAVCGTANDVAVSGAIPRYLSCGFILEEGLEMATLEAVVASMADARAAGSPSSPAIPKWCRAARRISCLSTPPASAPSRRTFAGDAAD